MTPICQASTYVQPDVAQQRVTRLLLHGQSNPYGALAALEGGTYVLAFASGMAAIDTILRLIKPGQHVLAGNDVYGGTFRLFDKVLSGLGIEFTFADTTDDTDVATAIQPNTKLIWLEPSTGPMLRLTNIADFVVHSSIEYIGGNSDVVGEAIGL